MKRSWQGALGEILLIFVGISLALVFENWNEDRRTRSQERAFVGQILDDLRRTRDELTRDDFPALRVQALAHDDIVTSVYGAGPIDTDSLTRSFTRLIAHGSVLYPQTAAYESLKSTGVDLIEDDSLRMAITGFFELGLERVATAEAALWRSHDQFLEPYVIEHFEAADSIGTAPAGRRRSVTPRDLEGLRRDPTFLLILYRIEADRRRVIEVYGGAERGLDRLIERLEMEVGR